MGVTPLASRVSHLTTAMSGLKLMATEQKPINGPPSVHLSKSLDPADALQVAFSGLLIDDENEPAHQPACRGDKPFNSHRITSLPMRALGKRGRSSRGRTAVALKVLQSIQNETSGLRAQVQDTPDSEVSFELLARVAMRLETFKIALDKTNRNEPEILQLKRVVIEEVDSLENICDTLRESVHCLKETGPVKFCSGKNYALSDLLFEANQ